MPITWRPDKLGLIASFELNGDLRVIELRPDARLSKDAEKFISIIIQVQQVKKFIIRKYGEVEGQCYVFPNRID